jgi:hypothetical protein
MEERMTEQTTTGGVGFAEDLGSLFGMWADPDGRECLAGDLAEEGAAAMAQEFRHAAELLDGLAEMAESVFGFGAYLVLLDARRHAREALAVAEAYAKEERT